MYTVYVIVCAYDCLHNKSHNYQVYVKFSEYPARVADEKVLPKGPINHYNYFSMALRQSIRDENRADEVNNYLIVLIEE